MDDASPTSIDLEAEFARFRTTVARRLVVVDGVPWTYVDAGAGDRAVLMLPGGSFRPDNYFSVINDLARDHRVVAPAYPAVHPLGKVLRGLGAILADAAVDTVTVFGCSYGGYIAQAMSAAMPARIEAVVLAQTSTRHVVGLHAMRLFALLFAPMPLGVKRNVTWWLWMRWFSAPAASVDFWRARLRAEMDEMTGAELMAGVLNIIDFMAHYTPDRGRLLPWEGPTLILESSQDEAFSAEQRAALRQAYPQATTCSLAGGHTALFTCPEQFATGVRQMSSRLPPGRARGTGRADSHG